jgi:hypothetical protein
MAPSLPDRFQAKPLRKRESAHAPSESTFTKRETDEAEDRAYGLVIEHALKVAGIPAKEVADSLHMEESNVRQWFIGKARAPIGRLRRRFPRFDRAYIEAIVASSESLELSMVIGDRRRA